MDLLCLVVIHIGGWPSDKIFHFTFGRSIIFGNYFEQRFQKIACISHPHRNADFVVGVELF